MSRRAVGRFAKREAGVENESEVVVTNETDLQCPNEQELMGALLVSSASLSREGMLSHLDRCDRCRCVIAEGIRTRRDGAEHPGFRTDIEAATLCRGDRLLGRFEVLSFVARGGMGEVYKVRDHALDELVALKTIASTMTEDEVAFTRFKREVQLARKVTHPNVCRILEFGIHQRPMTHSAQITIPFLVMEFLDGETLRRRIRRQQPMSLSLVRALARQMASALAAIHQANVIHGDLKSDNVFLVGRGAEEPRPVLVDFGLARPMSREDGRSGALRSILAGTPAYMAPEQLLGAAPTRSSDIYALGVVLFEMLTGRLPFDAEALASSPSRLAARLAPPPSELRSNIPPAWDDLLARCLSYAKADRFPDVEAVLAAIERIGEPLRPGAVWSARRRPRAAILLGAAALLATSAVFLFRGGPRSALPSTTAEVASRPSPSRFVTSDLERSAAAPLATAAAALTAAATVPDTWQLAAPAGERGPRLRRRGGTAEVRLTARHEQRMSTLDPAENAPPAHPAATNSSPGNDPSPPPTPLPAFDGAVSPRPVRQVLHPDDVFDPYQQP